MEGISVSTAYEKLDDAIHEYLLETTDYHEGRAISGWQLSFETTILVNVEGALPLASAQHYTFGPQTTLGLALGLARYAAGVYEASMVNPTLDGDDDS